MDVGGETTTSNILPRSGFMTAGYEPARAITSRIFRAFHSCNFSSLSLIFTITNLFSPLTLGISLFRLFLFYITSYSYPRFLFSHRGAASMNSSRNLLHCVWGNSRVPISTWQYRSINLKFNIRQSAINVHYSNMPTTSYYPRYYIDLFYQFLLAQSYNNFLFIM